MTSTTGGGDSTEQENLLAQDLQIVLSILPEHAQVFYLSIDAINTLDQQLDEMHYRLDLGDTSEEWITDRLQGLFVGAVELLNKVRDAYNSIGFWNSFYAPKQITIMGSMGLELTDGMKQSLKPFGERLIQTLEDRVTHIGSLLGYAQENINHYVRSASQSPTIFERIAESRQRYRQVKYWTLGIGACLLFANPLLWEIKPSKFTKNTNMICHRIYTDACGDLTW